MSSATTNTSELTAGTPAGESREWNWHPDLPINTSPVFEKPPRPFASLRWYAGAWLPISELLLYVVIAFAVWSWLQPPLEQTQTLAPGWIAAIWLRNIAMLVAFATILHLWLYTWKKQGDALRYDRRGPTAKARIFAFGSQLWDNVAYSLISGVGIWTIYEAGLWWGYANSVLPTVTLSANPVWFVLWFPLIGVWYSFHFYWAHRFLHWAPMYRRVHSVPSPQYCGRPLVGFFDAPDRTCVVPVIAADPSGRPVAPHSHAVSLLLADAGDDDVPLWL